MQQLGYDLKRHTEDIARLWAQVLAKPPFRLPPGHDLGALPEILHDLVEVSFLHPYEVQAHERKVTAAVRHGERRREAGQEERVITEEFASLRDAIRRYVGTCDLPRAKAREAVVRLDMAISVAEQAAMRGYHRDAFVQLGKWEDLVAQLARQSPLLGLPER